MNCPECNNEMFIWQRSGAPWKATCLNCLYQETVLPGPEELEPSIKQYPKTDYPSCLVPEDERY